MNHKAHLKPYLINAFYTWAMDLEFTPLIEVNHLFLKNQNILLENKSSNFIFNIHPAATRNMIFSKMGITFETTINNETNIINIHENLNKSDHEVRLFCLKILDLDLEEPKKYAKISSLPTVTNSAEK